jgi:hypothetical protein
MIRLSQIEEHLLCSQAAQRARQVTLNAGMAAQLLLHGAKVG